MNLDYKDYELQAEIRWGSSDAYKEYKEQSKGRCVADNDKIQHDMMLIFSEFAALDCAPDDEAAQKLVAKLQQFITENYYHCTDEILAGLGKIYAVEGGFKKNINSFVGEGTADFASKAIENFTK